jgi:transposase
METQSKLPVKRKYTQKWHLYNLAKCNEGRLFYKLLHELCQIIPEPEYKFGRPMASPRDLFFSLGLKLYSNFSSRKISSDLKHAEGYSYIKKAPHFNTLTDFLGCPATHDLLLKLLTISAMPLKELEDDYSMDSSGFGSYQYERWQKAKFQTKRGWRNYLKGHICIGTRTNIICSVSITPGNFSDIKQAPLLIKKTAANFKMKTVTGDKAYSSHRLFSLIKSYNAMPYIDFKANAAPTANSPEIWRKMFKYFQEHKEDFMKKYHRRSNVETVFSMVKVRLGEHLKCKNFENQRNELVMKFICHNVTVLIQEIYENEIHIDFKECLNNFVDKKATDDYPKTAIRDFSGKRKT